MPSHRQLKTIWMAARQLGLDEQQLRDVVQDLSGQRSLSALSPAQTRELIDRLVRLGAQIEGSQPKPRTKPSGRRTPAGVVKLISGEQQAMIADLRVQLGGDWLRDSYFEGACKRSIKHPRPRTGGEAARVIEMLLRRLEHDRAKARRQRRDGLA